MWFRYTASYGDNDERYNLNTTASATPMVLATDFRHATITVFAEWNANATIQFYTGNWDINTQPDLTQPASVTNEYTTAQVIDLSDGQPVSGETGIVFTWSQDGISRYEVNDNNNNWVGVRMTARSAGNVRIKIDLSDNS